LTFYTAVRVLYCTVSKTKPPLNNRNLTLNLTLKQPKDFAPEITSTHAYVFTNIENYIDTLDNNRNNNYV